MPKSYSYMGSVIYQNWEKGKGYHYTSPDVRGKCKTLREIKAKLRAKAKKTGKKGMGYRWHK